MSAGAFLTGIAAALLFSVSAVSADSHGKKAKSDHSDGAAYASSFPFRSSACGIPSEGKVTAETLRGSANAFEHFAGSGSYAAAFFKSGSMSAGSGAEHHLTGSAGSSFAGSSFGSGSNPGHSGNSTPSAGKPSHGAAGQSNGNAANGNAAQGHSSSSATAKHLPQGSGPTPNPEPGTILLFATGVSGLLMARRRNSKKSE